MPRPQAPPGFVTIGDGIHISLAPTSALPLQPSNSAPNVILIFGWMKAPTRHLQSYIRKYAELHPHATQIVVRCEPFFFVASERGQQNRLLPVAEALESLGCLPSVNTPTREPVHVRPRILVHSFSNGGGLQLASLGYLLSSRYPSVPPLEHLVSALIFDSFPSTGSFRAIRMTFSIAIRNPIIRYIAMFFAYVVHALRLSLRLVYGEDMMGKRYFQMLLNPHLLPWMNSQTPRLYVFSKKDKLVPWKEVQQHADAARASGLIVRCEVYEDSAHVTHVCSDPERYWASIQDLWEIACRPNQVKDVGSRHRRRSVQAEIDESEAQLTGYRIDRYRL